MSLQTLVEKERCDCSLPQGLVWFARHEAERTGKAVACHEKMPATRTEYRKTTQEVASAGDRFSLTS